MMFETRVVDSIDERREIVFRERSESEQDIHVPVLSDVNIEQVYISGNFNDHLVLGVNVQNRVASALCDIGRVASRRWVASAKNKLWWMTHSWGEDMCDVPIETQFLLVELESKGWYAIILPLIHESFTAMLRGGGKKDRYVLCSKYFLHLRYKRKEENKLLGIRIQSLHAKN